MAKQFWYSTEQDEETRFSLKDSGWDLASKAADAAEDYHRNHDGWEASWPLEITLYDSEDGPAVGRFLVELESEPHFYPRQIKEATR